MRIQGWALLCVIFGSLGATSGQAKLSVSISSHGDFRRTDVGNDAYVLTVSNTGNASTDGQILLSDFLPPGLTPIGIGGAGWHCGMAPLVCSRADVREVLAPGEAFPDIALSVSISGTTLDSVKNRVVVQAGDGKVTVATFDTPINAYAAPVATNEDCSDARKLAIQKGYNVLTYDANTGKTDWSERHRELAQSRVGLNPYLPVAYTKEQIMVEVCGLKFDTAVNVSPTAIAVPESGADIRGATPNAPPNATVAAGSTYDTLQAVLTSTNSALAAMFTPQTTTAAISENPILAPGNETYQGITLAQVAATAEDFSRIFRAYREEAQSTAQAMQAMCRDKAFPCERIPDSIPVIEPSSTGTSWDLAARAAFLYHDILRLSSSLDSEKNVGQFDEAKARAQQFSVLLSAFDSEIAASQLGARLASLANTYRTLAGSLVAIHELQKADLEAAGVTSFDCPYIIPPTVAATDKSPASAPVSADYSRAEYCSLQNFQTKVMHPPSVCAAGR